jgi:V/A-type H+-transporting ATPase subunit E
MGHEELVRHLIAEAERRRDEILSQARQAARGRIARAQEEAAAMEREFHESLEREIARERDLRISRARAEAAAMEIRAQTAFAGAVLDLLADRLSRLPGEARYPRVGEALYREILPELPPGDVVLRMDAKTREAIEPLTAGMPIRFAPLPQEELGGVEVSDEEGRIRIRNTLRGRLQNARPELLAEIRRRLRDVDE